MRFIFVLIFLTGCYETKAVTPPIQNGITTEIGAENDNIETMPIRVGTVQVRIRPDKYGWDASLLLVDAKLDQLKLLGINAVISVDGFPENADYIHSSPLFWSNPTDLAEVVRFAFEVSQRYANRPNVLAYQFMSEPVNVEGGAHYPAEMDQLNLDIIDAIRSNTYRQKVIVAQAVWGFCQDQKIIDRKGIVYGCHYYSPHFMTHQGINGNPSNVPWPTELNGKPWDRDRLVQTLASTRKFQVDNNAEIYIGEFGCLRWGPNCDLYLYDLTSIFKAYKWPFQYFQLNGWNGWNPYYSDTLSPNPEDDYVGYGSKRWGVLTTIYGL